MVIKMKKINVTDTTLKSLAESRKVSLLFREKTAIAMCAASFGVDAVELASVKNLREDRIIYKTIAKNVRDTVLAIPVGSNVSDVADAWECIKEAERPRLQVELPVSTVQMEYAYHVKAEKMIGKISELIKAAKEFCDDVEFSALDATRSDVDFLISVVKEAQLCGATLITFCDDAGTSLPDEVSELVKRIKSEVDVPVYVRLSDRINVAVASSIAAIVSGADGVKCAMTGENVLLTGAFSDAVNACKSKINAETNLDCTKIHSSIEDVMSGMEHESYDSYETVSERKKILLDSDSTISQVSQAVQLLGYDLSDEDCGNVYRALMQVCEKKNAVGAKELEALVASSAMQAPSTYHFENYTTNSSNLMSSMSRVTLRCNDEIISGVSTGDGPIDSAFRAIEQCVGYHYELDDFQVQAVTEGREALGSALVRLRNNGKLYSGNGISTDIVAASIRAYVNALNKIVFDEGEK